MKGGFLTNGQKERTHKIARTVHLLEDELEKKSFNWQCKHHWGGNKLGFAAVNLHCKRSDHVN